MSIPPRHSTGSNGAATTTLTASTAPATAAPEPTGTSADDGLQETSTLSERELYKIEFFKTYDVMTGVRIAATLGGFFSLMIFLVIYKSKCSRGAKSVASDVAIELDAVSELPYDTHGPTFCSPRISLGNMSAPAASLRTRYSNSSYVNMLNYEPKSLPGSVMGWPSRGSHQWSEPPFRQRASLDTTACSTSRNSSFLTVPGVRLSSTGSSSDSSYYLEHRSLMELGLPPPMVFAPNVRVKGRVDGVGVESGRAADQSARNCAININVIQPTPDISPCNSEKQLNYRQRRAMMLAAPLASCGSATLGTFDEQADARSIGSDSVFYNDEYWLGSDADDATLCDDSSCSSDGCSECSSTSGATGGTASRDQDVSVVPDNSSSSHSQRTPSPPSSSKQGPNVVVVLSPPQNGQELSSCSNKMTANALDQLASKVDGNNELITETVF
ncbi:uncharacterized protein LOC132199311 [Neocloeon triangulifer]|uniref:uncharacterized protein LOC132199311 n=1 Tax=Neocloeon triangulifer TaxID=2078957 RepID=UPI00286F9FB4|nr:uncharacterized protein LOC132199311 [Neocloeon triangulifer]XP_059479912.1 uncharacterized protein LOC132199311 [Neocloeon triangulifer]